jgi:hypothetical protein
MDGILKYFKFLKIKIKISFTYFRRSLGYKLPAAPKSGFIRYY